MDEYFLEDGANFFLELLGGAVKSLSEMQILKSEILKNNLFSDPSEKEEILLLIDEIIWEETHAAESFRLERKSHLLAIAHLSNSIQEREAQPEGLPGGRQNNLIDGMAERTRPGATLPLFPEVKDSDARSEH